jgi:hypothetical protein
MIRKDPRCNIKIRPDRRIVSVFFASHFVPQIGHWQVRERGVHHHGAKGIYLVKIHFDYLEFFWTLHKKAVRKVDRMIYIEKFEYLHGIMKPAGDETERDEKCLPVVVQIFCVA